MNPRFLTSFVLGASFLSGVASAEPTIDLFEAHNDMNAGALWRNDRPRNNDQRGVGLEHQSITLLTGGKVVVVGSGSYTDITPMIAGAGLSSQQAGVLAPTDGNPGVQATGNRVEGLCASYNLDATQGLVKTNMAFFTNNKSPDWQNMHKPHVQPINGGTAALVLYGHDPNGNRTRIYGMVLGPNCEILSAQTQLFADNNDDYGGLYESADSVYSDVGGTSQVVLGWIGNGNGTDDAHEGSVTVTATGKPGAAAYTLKPDWEISINANEERSRGTIQKTPFPGMSLYCLGDGNDQPVNNVVCGMVNTAPGVPDDQRRVWRQTVMKRQGNVHYTTPSLVPVSDATGKPTDKFILTYVKVDTTNRNGRSKGKTEINTVPIQLTVGADGKPTGLTMLDTPTAGMFGIADGAHPGMIPATYGIDNRPVAFLFAGAITDGGLATAKIIGLTPDNKLEPVRALNWANASSGGYTSQWYGHNPNTPQGRSYPVTGLPVANPGYGQAGGYQPDVKSFLLLSNVYHNDHSGGCATDPNKGTNNGTCGGKNAFGLVLIPTAADATAAPGSPDDPTPTDPTKPVASDPGTTLGGCSTSGGAGAGTLVLLGFAVVVIRRRRAN
jgi:uncharacterized protein (TIGR03382 family)